MLRNDLIELIQYSPTTETVFAEPILIVPAWIMKYYILDLSARNSLVKFLVSQGHTVFMVSWKNPHASDRGLGMDDYLRLGIRSAIDAVSQIVPERKIHTVGYCIGGTLLSIAAAMYAAEGDQRLASKTLLAAQQDFSEPGELSVFISPSQLDMLESVMQRSGVLKSEQMGAAFALLRSRDLLWTPAVNTYVRGKRATPNDLMAWNSDGTRMPCRMHAEYLRQLYLNNALARGEFHAEGRRVDLGRHPIADVRRGHRDRSCRAVAVHLQGARPDALERLHLSADLGRPQCRHRERRRAPPAAAPRTHVVECHRHAHAAGMVRHHGARGGIVVADLAALARGALDAGAGWPAVARLRRGRLSADRRCSGKIRTAALAGRSSN